jgi:prepilin-type N-terminal cleavage/methylation domain-containing protein
MRPLRRGSAVGGWVHGHHARAFTLLELLVVIAILGLLLGILAPSLSRAKLLAKVAKTKVELDQVATALMTYYSDQHAFPPSRTYCEYGPPEKVHDWAELPPELATAGYFPPGPTGTTITVNAMDPFNPGRTYKYLHPGKGYHNNASTYTTIWVADGFPRGDGTAGRDYSNETDSPVSFVVFSLGTFGDIGYTSALGRHQPCNTQDWFSGNNKKGLIVRACLPSGSFMTSP